MNLFNKYSDNWQPLARPTDPPESHLAADHIRPKLGKLHKETLLRVEYWLETYGSAGTANEIAMGNESIRKRFGELVRMGYLTTGPARTCSKTGRKAATYRIKGK